MALQKQKIPLELTTGIDTKTDEFNNVSFKNVENFRYNKPGALNKVNGYTAYTTSLLNVSATVPAIDSAVSLYSYKNELLLNTKNQLLTYDAVSNKWSSKNYLNVNSQNFSYKKTSSNITFVETTEQTVFDDYAGTDNVDKYVDSDYTMYTLSKSLSISEIRLKIETTADQVIVLDTYIPNGAPPANRLSHRTTRALGVYQGYAYVLCFEASGPSCLIYKYNLSQPNAAPQIINTSTSYFDCAYLDQAAGTIYLVGANTTTLNITRYNIGAGTLQFTVDTCPSGYTTSYIDDLSAEGLLKITGKTGTTLTTANLVKSTRVLSGSFTNVDTTVDTFTTANDGVNVYYVWQSTATTSGGVYISALASDNTTNVLGGTYRIAGYASVYMKALYNSGNIYVNTVTREAAQKTNLIAKIAVSGLAEGSRWELIAKSGYISSKANESHNRLFLVNNILHSIQEVLSTTSIGVSIEDSAAFKNLQTVKHDLSVVSTKPSYTNNTLVVPNSIVRMYDGATMTESGFITTPEISGSITQVSGPDSAYFVNGQTYGIALIYSWIDNNGVKHRSVPYLASVVISGASIRQLSFSVKQLAHTFKEQVQIEVYRTTVNGSVYYKHDSQVYSNIENDSLQTITLNSTSFTDAQLQAKETLYTTGGVLENDNPDSAVSSAVHKNRVFLLNRDKLQYSKIISLGEPITFNGNLLIRPENNLGKLVGIEAMDNVLVIFTEEGIFIQSGEGPNNLGEQDDFGEPQKITADVGCSDPRSIVSTPEGIMFKSEKGIYLLNRGLYVSYIGAPVEQYNSEVILGSQLLNNTNEVRFMTSSKILSYDYFTKQWSIYTNLTGTAVDCVIHDNAFHYVNSLGVVHTQSAGFTIPSAFYAGKLETNWITVAGINSAGALARSQQGFQRLYTIYLLGKYKSAHNLQVKIAYDYDETIVDTATIVPTGTGVYQWTVKPSIQKCEAFKLYIQDTSQSGTGESLVLSGIVLEVGIKGSAQKTTSDSSTFPTT